MLHAIFRCKSLIMRIVLVVRATRNAHGYWCRSINLAIPFYEFAKHDIKLTEATTRMKRTKATKRSLQPCHILEVT